MYTLMQTMSWRRFLIEQVPILFISLIIAETFYKFGSFTLEAIAFLATWYVVDAAARIVINFVKKPLNKRHER